MALPPAIDRPILLDGGMGRELRARGVELSETIWSANALLVAPDIVRQIHIDYIDAGADVITTNTYGVIRTDLRNAGIEGRFAEMNVLAGELARDARAASGRPVLIAGSLPPLRGSYRPDLVGPLDEVRPLYREQADLLAPYVDLFLCETMSSGGEALAAASAATETGLPVWVSFTLDDHDLGRLRSGETIGDALELLRGLPVEGVLANCCAPESISAALPEIVRSGRAFTGGYANTFQPVPSEWTLEGDGFLPTRDDLDAQAYATHAWGWLEAGATVVGGCCGTGPEHIQRLRTLIDAVGSQV
jgi:S-methylmethionine-dependent homocysteine/selenocysteine methylase